MEQELKKRILKMVEDSKEKMEEETGIASSMTAENTKEYLELVMTEKKDTYHRIKASKKESCLHLLLLMLIRTHVTQKESSLWTMNLHALYK